MDIRDLAAGTVLTLPVETEGALFSLGDTHAAQGDGEVCGTAIESPMDVTVRLEVLKGGAPPFPYFTAPGSVTRHLDEKGYDGVYQPGMTVCLESYIGEVGGDEGVKPERQGLITGTGIELLSTFPYEEALLLREV